MDQMTPQVSQWLDQARQLSEQDRELLVKGLIESLANEPPNAESEVTWSEEVKRRVHDVRSERAKTIPGA
jgi:putative addiction module component (TIGR02574 family)